MTLNQLPSILLSSSFADWQYVVVCVIVAAAFTYLVWRLSKALRAPESSSCGQCQQGPQTGVVSKPLVTLDSLTASAKTQREASNKGRSNADQRR